MTKIPNLTTCIILVALIISLTIIPTSAKLYASQNPLTDKIITLSTDSNINTLSYFLDNPQNTNFPIPKSSENTLKNYDKYKIQFSDNPVTLYFVKYNGIYSTCLPAFDCDTFPLVTLSEDDINFAYENQEFLESITADHKITRFEQIKLFFLRNSPF